MSPEAALPGILGLRNGDRIEAVNGFDIGSPENALRAYARLRSADSLSVKIARRGETMTLDYQIR